MTAKAMPTRCARRHRNHYELRGISVDYRPG